MRKFDFCDVNTEHQIVPRTIRSLKRKRDQLWAAIPKECSTTFRERLHDFIPGSLTHPQDEAQAIIDDLMNTLKKPLENREKFGVQVAVGLLGSEAVSLLQRLGTWWLSNRVMSLHR